MKQPAVEIFIWAYPFLGEVLMIWLSAGVGWLVFVRVRHRWMLVGLNGLVIGLLCIGVVDCCWLLVSTGACGAGFCFRM
jgi:hypothetical protein